MGTPPRSNWNLDVLVFEERGKPDYLEKNLSEQEREPTTNSTHMTPGPGVEPKPLWWEASALTTAPSLLPKVFLWRKKVFVLQQFSQCFFSSLITYCFIRITANKREYFCHGWHESLVPTRIRLIFRRWPTVPLLNICSPALQSTHIMYAFLNWQRSIQLGRGRQRATKKWRSGGLGLIGGPVCIMQSREYDVRDKKAPQQNDTWRGNVVIALELKVKFWTVTIFVLYFPVVLPTMLCKVVFLFESVDEILKCDHSNESYLAVLSCGTVHFATVGDSNFWVSE